MPNTIYLEPKTTLVIEDASGNTQFKISGSGEMTINGSILPVDTGSNDIGSVAKPFHDLYVTTESIKFVQNGSVVETMTKDDYTNIKTGRYDSIGQQDITIDGNFIPASDATYTLGTARKRFSRLYVASHIDVSGSQLVISSPSASAVGDDFSIVVSGSIIPSNSESISLGTVNAPFQDLYVSTSSIKFVKDGAVVDTMTRDDFKNLKEGRIDRIAQQDLTVDGNIVPSRDATYALGGIRKRFSRLYTASEIDVSGSQLVINPSASNAAGDTFNLVVSGNILPADSDVDSIGSEAAPFKDLYVTTGSIIYVDRSVAVGHANRKISFSKHDVQRLREGKPLRATDAIDDSDRVRAKMTGGIEITGSLIKDGVTLSSTITELNILDGVTATTSELNIMDGVTSTTTELNKLDGFTGDVDDLNYAKDLKATGVTATEFDYLDGVTSAIQTQLSGKFSSTGGRLSGQIYERFTAFTDQDTTPSVSAGNMFKTANTRATAIANLDDIADGQEVTIVVNDANTDFTHGARGSAGELRLNGARDWTACAAGDTITFVGMDIDGRGTIVAFEKCRSDNT